MFNEEQNFNVLYSFILTVLIAQKKRKQTAIQIHSEEKIEDQANNRENIANLAHNEKNIENRNTKAKKRKRENDEQDMEKKKMKTKNHRETKTSHEIRYKPSINHMPGTDHKKRVRCKFEGCELSSSNFCTACGVHLCIKSDPANTQEKNCFIKYHTLPK